MRWKNIEVISWDVDGTLYSMRRVVLWLTALAAKRLAWPGPRPTLRELRELKRHQLRMAAVRRRGGQITDEDRAFRTTGLEALEKRWYVRAIGLAGPRGGVAETIATLSQLGLRQVVVSDYDADHKLECLGLQGQFEEVFSGEALGHLKPDPKLFQYVADRLGVAPARILHIGDLVKNDAAAATGAGCLAATFGVDLNTPQEIIAGLEAASTKTPDPC